MRTMFRGKAAQEVMAQLENGNEINCSDFPTGKLLVLDHQEKYDAWGRLIELLVDY